MKRGDTIRSRHGPSPLWRVEEVYVGGSPYLWAKLLTPHRGRRAGHKQMLRQEDYDVEPEQKGESHAERCEG